MKVDELMFKPPWLLTTFQWLAIGTLSASAVIDAATDHGILMAINCFCLGIVFFSMLCQKLIAGIIREAGEARDGFQNAEAMMQAVMARLEEAIESGRVEVVPVHQPFESDGDHPTKH